MRTHVNVERERRQDAPRGFAFEEGAREPRAGLQEHARDLERRERPHARERAEGGEGMEQCGEEIALDPRVKARELGEGVAVARARRSGFVKASGSRAMQA